MAKYMQGLEDNVLSKIPNLLDAQDEVFGSAEELTLVLRFLNKVLSSSDINQNRAVRNESYLINKIEVEFREDAANESVVVDHARSRLVVFLPVIKGEKKTELDDRRRSHLLKYSAIVEELRMRALIQAYRALDKKARKKILTISRIDSKKRNGAGLK